MHRQLAEIHDIAAAHLAECARWRRSDSTPRPIRAGTEWQGPDDMPSVTRTSPLPRLTSSPKPRYSGGAHMSSPRLTGGPIRWVLNLSSVRGTRATMSPVGGGNTVVTLMG
jgi:hypothetical protein